MRDEEDRETKTLVLLGKGFDQRNRFAGLINQ